MCQFLSHQGILTILHQRSTVNPPNFLINLYESSSTLLTEITTMEWCHLFPLWSTSKPWRRICKSLPTQDLGNRAKSQSAFVKLIEYSKKKKKVHTYLLKPKCKFTFPLRTLCSCFQKVDIYLHKCFLKESWIFMCAYASILKVPGRLREDEKLFNLRQNKIMLVWSWVRNLPDTNSQNGGGSWSFFYIIHYLQKSEVYSPKQR